MNDTEFDPAELKRELEEAAGKGEKPLSELVYEEYFKVEEVTSSSYATSFTPLSECVMGGISPEYSGGFTSGLVLKVKPESNIPIKELHFRGFSIAKAGDYILAKVSRYNEREVFRDMMEPICGDNSMTRKGYFKRDDYRKAEEAVEIKIIEEKNKTVLRTDRAVDFSRFVKRE